jgi:hypothetical protein
LGELDAKSGYHDFMFDHLVKLVDFDALFNVIEQIDAVQ